LLRRADRVDAFASPQIRIARDGALFIGDEPLRDPLLVNRYVMEARFVGAGIAARTNLFDLWRPAGTPRLSLLVGGRYFDGLLALDGYVRIWPTRAGVLALPLSLPDSAPQPVTLTFRSPSHSKRVTLRPGQKTTVRFEVPATGVWTVRWKSKGGVYLSDGRPVSVASAAPVYK
jgi:hypothetical protein